MNIVIAGAGAVGSHLAKLLSNEAHNIILVDTDKTRLQYITGQLDVIAITGNATSRRVLMNANISKTDLLIAATNSDTSNITIAIIGKKLGAKHCVARINNLEFIEDSDILGMRELGIDSMISPEALAADEISRLVKQAAFTETFDLENGALKVFGIHLEKDAPIIGRSVEEVAAQVGDLKFLTVAINRDDRTLIPRRHTVFARNDHAYFIAPPEGVSQIMELTGKREIQIRNIMILGGSGIGVSAAKQLSKDYHVKLVEKDRDKCFDLADELPNVLIVNGDCTDVQLLEQEYVSQMDAFVAVTGNSETNIMSCLVAKNHGVKKTIALVENIEYIHLSMNIGIDTLINKKHIAANHIFRYIRKGEVLDVAGFHGLDAEVMEFDVKPNTRITRAPIRDLGLPRTAIIGGVIRNGKGMKTLGDFTIQAGDKCVVFSLPDAIAKVESYFR